MACKLLLLFCLQIVFLQTGVFGVTDIGDVADAIGKFFGAVENCEYECPRGGRPRPNPAHKPTTNGCGTYGFEVRFDNMPKVTKCCDEHDICYGSCGVEKQLCDKQLQKCVNKICQELPKKPRTDCTGVEHVAMTAVGSSLGCQAFRDSQEKACVCDAQENRQTTSARKRGGRFGYGLSRQRVPQKRPSGGDRHPDGDNWLLYAYARDLMDQ